MSQKSAEISETLTGGYNHWTVTINDVWRYIVSELP